MAVEVDTDPAFKLGKTAVLFKGAYSLFTNPDGTPETSWDIRPDGKKFLMIKPAATTTGELTTEGQAVAAPQPKIIIVTNWFEELKERVPAH